MDTRSDVVRNSEVMLGSLYVDQCWLRNVLMSAAHDFYSEPLVFVWLGDCYCLVVVQP